MIHQFNSSEIRLVLNVKRLSTIAKYRKKGMPCIRRNKYYYYNEQEVMEWYKNYKKKGERSWLKKKHRNY